MANSSTNWTTGIKTIWVSRKSSRNWSTPAIWLLKRVSSKCSNIFDGVPDITVYLTKSIVVSAIKIKANFPIPIGWNIYLKVECMPCCLATRSSTKTSLPCSCNRNVLASTSRRIRLKYSLSTRSKWQFFSLRIIVAALCIHKNK